MSIISILRLNSVTISINFLSIQLNIQVYGAPSVPTNKVRHSALEVIKGTYRSDQQEPDIDLGKSILPGFRNVTSERYV